MQAALEYICRMGFNLDFAVDRSHLCIHAENAPMHPCIREITASMLKTQQVNPTTS
jgi:hypothetical protein